MLENLQSVTLLTIMEIVGPILLGVALWYGIVRTRRLSKSQREATDRATQRLYRQESDRN
jgi:NhaP-type Na+/H+ or K+/H+ antiporter